MGGRIAIALLTAAGAAIVCAVALGSGGSTISAAQPLPLGAQTSSGALRTKKLNGLPWGAEYWKVSMSSGDHLVVDYSAGNELGVGLCILSPSVTDFTEQTSQCLASSITGASTELKFTAPVDGAYTARFATTVCACTDPLTYSFMAHVLAPTHMTLRAPHVFRARTTLRVTGVVLGGATGSVAVKISGPQGQRKVVPLQAGGGFHTAFRISKRGDYTLAASFYGDGAHLASSKSVRLVAK